MDTTNHFRFPPGNPVPNTFNFNFNQPSPSSTALAPSSRSQQQQQKNPSQPRQIHRNRVSYSCHACRRRKVKCNRQHPVCSNCIKTAESCVYDHAIIHKGKDERGQKTIGAVKRRRTNEGVSTANEDGEGGYSREDIVSGNSSTTAAISPPRSLDTNKEVELKSLETRINRIAKIVDQWTSVNGVPPNGRAARPGPRTPDRNDTLAISGLAGNEFAHTLQQSTGPTRYGPAEVNHPAPAPPSPTRTRSPNTPTTPESSICSRRQDVTETDGVQTSNPTPKINEKIDPVRQSGKDDDVDDLGLGHLSIQDDGRYRYVGASFWGLLGNETNELNEVLKAHTLIGGTENRAQCKERFEQAHASPGSSSNSPPAAPPHPWPESTSPVAGCSQIQVKVNKASLLQFESREIKARTCEIVSSILESLPKKTVSDHLYKSFLHGVHPVMPLLHAPTFDKDYKHFWKWYSDNQHGPGSKLAENLAFISLLMAVLYAGAISMSNKTVQELTAGGYTKISLSSHLYEATMSALVASTFPRSPTVNSLISFLVVQTCLIREEEPLTSCSFVGMAMRVAQSMGLHRDGSLFGLSEIECEVRRRVWWHIMYLDVQGAIAIGLPPIGGSAGDMYDTKMVSELKDEYIGLPPGAADPVTPMTPHNTRCQEFYKEKIDTRSSPAMILAVGRYESTILLRSIIYRLHAVRGSRGSDLMEMGKMIYALKMDLEKKISRIPVRGIPEMGFIPPRVPGEEGGAGVEPSEVERVIVFNSWARIMLSLLSDRAFGVLYQPFLKSAKSNLWKHSRSCALNFCHSFLSKFLHLSRSQLFQPYQWFCPGTYQPLHATMILLLDLHERPAAPEAPKSRKFIDEVFAVFGEHGNYSTGDGEGGNRPLMEGGREAWRMLWRLRKKAYEKAGVQIPTEQEEEGRSGKEPGEPGPGENRFFPTFVQYASQVIIGSPASSVPPPFPDIPMRPPTPTPTVSSDPIGGSFEELLEMGTIIDAEGKAFSTGEVAEFLQKDQVHNSKLGSGIPEDVGGGDATQAQQDNQFGPMAGGQDMMDFDWEEWDQVFGRYVSVDVGDVS